MGREGAQSSEARLSLCRDMRRKTLNNAGRNKAAKFISRCRQQGPNRMLLLAKTARDLLHHWAAVRGVAHVLRFSRENGTGAKNGRAKERKLKHENDGKQNSTGRWGGGFRV